MAGDGAWIRSLVDEVKTLGSAESRNDTPALNKVKRESEPSQRNREPNRSFLLSF